MDRILELLARLAELTTEELVELNDLIQAEADRLEGESTTADTVAALGQLADAREQVTAEETRRDEAQAELDTQREAALARLRPAEEPAEDESDAGDEPPAGEGDEPAGEQPAEQPEPVAASAAARRPSLQRLAAGRAPSRTPERRPADDAPSRTTVTAASNGQRLESRADVATVMSRAIEDTRGLKSSFKRSVVHAVTEFPEDRRLRRDQGSENTALVASVLGTPGQPTEALTAAGGLCAPVDNLYDVRVMGSTARPVRDALAPFQADRGGVNLRPDVVFSDWNTGVGVWTLQDDIDAATAGAPDPTKAIIEATCPGFEDFFVDAVTARVKFRNVTARFDPEGTAANVEALGVAHARLAENTLLSKLAAESIQVTSTKRLGASRDLLVTLDKVQAYHRSRRRLADNVPLRYIAPRWLRDLLRADITRGDMSLDALAVADDTINGWFARRSITPTWHLDGRPTAVAAAVGPPVVNAIAAQEYSAVASGGEVPGFPAQVESFLFADGDFLFLDGGELDLGVVRDSGLNEVNAYELFRETFEGLASRGQEPLQLVASLEPTGQFAAGTDTSAFND